MCPYCPAVPSWTVGFVVPMPVKKMRTVSHLSSFTRVKSACRIVPLPDLD
jgi:hypothetical protein